MDISKYLGGDNLDENIGVWLIVLTEPINPNLSAAGQINLFYQHGILAGCNLVMAKMYGFTSADDLIGLHMGDLMPANAANLEFFEAFIANNYKLSDAESKETDKDGKTVYFLNSLEGIIENGLLVAAKGEQKVLIK